MFLFRILFWIVIVILILPAPSEPRGKSEAAAPGVTVTRAVGAARATVSDMAGFCQRNAEVCVTGRAALTSFWAKARYGAGLLAEIVNGADEGPGSAQTGSADVHDTLRPDDLVPAWRGPRAGDA